MTVQSVDALPDLYLRDETQWLDIMSRLAGEGRIDELDLPHLAEYLSDMAHRDRREVQSWLVVLITHRLKWEYQPERRSRSSRSTVIEQRQELDSLAGGGVLRRHAEDVLAKAYQDAVERAAAETGLAAVLFPSVCPYTFDGLLVTDLKAESD